MSLNQTPRSNRVHIAFFGRRNAGKSSLINAVTNQETALVSKYKGTTTDPVYKAMEILPLGPVVLIDTAGIDDEGELGTLRIKKTREVLNKTDLAVYVLDGTEGLTNEDKNRIHEIKSRGIPLIGVVNKSDIKNFDAEKLNNLKHATKCDFLPVSALSGKGIEALKMALAKSIPSEETKFKIVGDLLEPGDFAVLVVPIDKAAPKGRLILPQQQTIRDILESDAMAIVTKEYELKDTLEKLGQKPKIVITDSQAFLKVAADTPKDIPMTSFSILFARHKGDLAQLVKGAKSIEKLKDGDKILIAEGCTHHRQSDDIGTVKIPRWIRQMTGKQLTFDHVSGNQFPDNLKDYALIVQCGGCMLNRRAMLYRIQTAVALQVPMVNYGILIAYVQGILERAIRPFPLASIAWEEESSI